MLSPRQRAALWRWGFLGLGLAAMVLGFFGFVAQSGWAWDRAHVHDALFKTVQLFALAVSVEHLENAATQLASVLAPVATAGTLWLAFFGRTEASVRLRILEGRRSRLEERLDALRSSLSRTRERLDSYTLELQQHGLESVEREVRWLDELIASERDAEPRTSQQLQESGAPSGQRLNTTSGAGIYPTAHGE